MFGGGEGAPKQICVFAYVRFEHVRSDSPKKLHDFTIHVGYLNVLLGKQRLRVMS